MSSSEASVPEIEAGSWLHFTGVAGSGMSALAQFHALGGHPTTGSDRAFDRGQQPQLRAKLEAMGVRIVPQDGSFPDALPERCAAVVASTAIEAKVPDLEAAQKAHIPVLHRSELLARHVAAHRTIAVTGTSGKSTVTAMIFAILDHCGKRPGLLTGGALGSLTAAGHVGNAWAPGEVSTTGHAPYLVIEADESDGSLVRYAPWLGVVLNLGLDHKEPEIVLEMFRTFATQTTGPLIVGDDARLKTLRSEVTVFAVETDDTPLGEAGITARGIAPAGTGSLFEIDGVKFTLPVPGEYNVANATAAVAACRAAGIATGDMVDPLNAFGGVDRRFVSAGTRGGVEVIDDFAHNPDKIAAALAAGRDRLALQGDGQGRILAVFQPHGFGPTRFLRQALVETFATHLRAEDILWLPEIFFAGGTVARDISSADLVADIRAAGRDSRFCSERNELPPLIAAAAQPGDLVLVMGARDPSLTMFCGKILENLPE